MFKIQRFIFNEYKLICQWSDNLIKLKCLKTVHNLEENYKCPKTSSCIELTKYFTLDYVDKRIIYKYK